MPKKSKPFADYTHMTEEEMREYRILVDNLSHAEHNLKNCNSDFYEIALQEYILASDSVSMFIKKAKKNNKVSGIIQWRGGGCW